VIRDYLYGGGHPLGPTPTYGISVGGWNVVIIAARPPADGELYEDQLDRLIGEQARKRDECRTERIDRSHSKQR
jgi:hypothetical protein